eukprot:TRINITY_DN6140_c0_g1_i4.p1 TRINITY_DN6140_c0_g1~~TRINITY_DN6140_c0_g1_i4.p1  ORF type:complete len:147 (-),score=38.79 TRINITY_DN6140_c0_g1_i4:248-688(-)
MVYSAFDARERERVAITSLFDSFVSKHLFTVNDLKKGLSSCMGEVQDVSIDFPNVTNYFSKFLVSSVLHRLLNEEHLMEILGTCTKSLLVLKVVKDTLLEICNADESEGLQIARQLASKLDLEQLCDPPTVSSFLKNNPKLLVFFS